MKAAGKVEAQDAAEVDSKGASILNTLVVKMQGKLCIRVKGEQATLKKTDVKEKKQAALNVKAVERSLRLNRQLRVKTKQI